MAYISDPLIVGAGAAGWTAALFAIRAGLRTVLSSPTELSGMMARARRVALFRGQTEPLSGRELFAKMRAPALQAGAEHLLESISAVDFSQPPHLIVYGGHQEHRVPAVIIAAGATGWAQKVPGEEALTGRGVCYCAACDGPFFAGEEILVVGDDEQALEAAIALSHVARSVTFVTQRPALEDASVAALAERPNIQLCTGLRLERILGEEAVTGAVFLDARGQEQILLTVGIFLYLPGNAPATDFLQGALATDEEGFILTNELGETNVPGVFAAGDVRSKPIRQMVVAATEGAIAAPAAERYIRRSTRIRYDHG